MNSTTFSSQTVAADDIPQYLKDRPQWVLWRYLDRGGKPTKVPYQRFGRPAKSNDPDTWCEFDEAMAAYEHGGFDGIGFVFATDDNLVGIDLDGCRDAETGEIAGWAAEIISRFDSYCEVSPSQTGVKLFVLGKNPHKSGKKVQVDAPHLCDKEPGIEMYDRSRYFAVTGQKLDGPAEPQERQSQLNWLAQRYWPARPITSETAPSPRAEKRVNGKDVASRARKYISKMPPAISGQGGHNQTFNVACVLYRFGLDDSDAAALMAEYNLRCEPPWDDAELAHKLDSARQQVEADGEFGAMLRDSHERRQVGGGVSSAPPAANGAKDESVYAAKLVRLSDVEPQEIAWLWENRIALGKLTLLSGNPGLGKSFLTLDLAARVSRGAKWPDDSGCAPLGGVVLISCEDDLSDTIRPRLDAAGADVSRIIALEGVAVKGDGSGDYDRAFDLERDLPALLAAVESVDDCRLVVIDPISAYCGKTDSHKNAETRALLAPLTAMAAERGFAIVAVSHRRKSEGAAIHSTMGSVAFVAAARAAFLIERDRDDHKRRLFLPMKNNVGEDRDGLAYTLSARHTGAVPCVEWCVEPVSITADEAIASQQKRGPKPEARDEAAEFIREALADGPRLMKDLLDEAQAVHGISKRTLDRAKQQVGVEVYRPENPGPWWWRLAEQEHIANPGEHIANPSRPKQCGYLGNVPSTSGKTTKNDPHIHQIAKLLGTGGISGSLPPGEPDWDALNGELAGVEDWA